MIVANMATYPPREAGLAEVLRRLSPQVNQINLVLNGYREVPRSLGPIANLNPIIPDIDYKDVGKFIPKTNPDDKVLLCDDDIIYPDNYVKTLQYYQNQFADLEAIIGLHGVIYSDFFDGDVVSRIVHVFYLELPEHRVVNQLGTGTVLLEGRQMPPPEFMLGSERFVDVRFALYAHLNGTPMICIKRPGQWLKQQEVEESIFESFTKGPPLSVIRETQSIAGFHKLDLRAVRRVSNL